MPGVRREDDAIPATEWLTAIKPLIDEGLVLRICPVGLSMYPFLIGGRDEAILRSPLHKAPAKGDIVLFSRDDGICILHRVHHLENGCYYMLGDAQTWIEGPVDRKDIHAVADAIVRKGKEIKCDSRLLRLLTGIWLILRPLRPLIIKTYRWVMRFIRRNKRS